MVILVNNLHFSSALRILGESLEKKKKKRMVFLLPTAEFWVIGEILELKILCGELNES